MRSSSLEIATSLVLCVAGTGCHVYHAGRDQLARQVQKDFSALDISASLDDEKALSDATLEAELQASTKYQLAIRDQHIALLLDMPLAKRDAACRVPSLGDKGTLVCTLDTELYRVLGPKGPKLLQGERSLEREELAVGELAQLVVEIVGDAALAAKLPPIDCAKGNLAALSTVDPLSDPRFAKASSDARQAAKEELARLPTLCKGIEDKRVPETELTGEYGAVLQQLALLRTARAVADGEAKSRESAYQAAKKDYDEAKSSPSPLETKLEQIAAAGTKLNQALDDLDAGAAKVSATLSNVGLAGNPVDVAALEARVSQVTATIRSILTDAAETYETSGISAVIGTLIEKQHIERDRSLPALLLEAEILRGRLTRAKAELAAGDSQIAALEEQRDALLRAGRQIDEARTAIRDGDKLLCSDALQRDSVADVVLGRRGSHTSATPEPTTQKPPAKPARSQQSAPPAPPPDGPCRRGVAGALVHYANAWTIGFVPARSAQLRYIGAVERGSLESSAAALEMWETSLAIPIDQLAAYHSGGVKPEDVAQIIVQAAGFAALTTTTGIQAAK